MNLAIRGIDARLELGDTFLNDKHPDLKADFILANPPFNMSDWSGEYLRDDIRWKYGVPPISNANYAWLQHFVHKLSPNGIAGIVLASSSLSGLGSEEEIRKNMVTAGLVDCIVELPSHLFYNTLISACLWFLSRNRSNSKFRNRINEILFIDAHRLGAMDSRTQKELTDKEIYQITQTYHNWRNPQGTYEDIDGFCKSITLEDVKANGYVLSPSRYVPAIQLEIQAGINFENPAESSKFELLKENLISSVSTISNAWMDNVSRRGVKSI